jgi:serine O-acetyltransferase
MKTALQIPFKIKERAELFAQHLFYALFDEAEEQAQKLHELKLLFLDITSGLSCGNCESDWKSFTIQFKEIKAKVLLDAESALKNDPAAKSFKEVVMAYPGFYVVAIYRISHELWLLNIPILPRMISEYAHSTTGADIHPGAIIGDSFFIDHATGVVIGETAVIKNNVTLYQGVTLGGIKVDKKLANTKRHPTIEDNVIIYANATILGGDVIVGRNSTIGANVWITKSIPENTMVSYKSEVKIISKIAINE